MSLLRRHPIAVALIVLVLWSGTSPLPALVDVATGAPTGAADLSRPIAYVVGAPLSDVLDTLTFLSLGRAQVLLGVWTVGLCLAGALRRGSAARRVRAALVGPLVLVGFVVAALLLPRPVPRLVSADPSVTVIDYHAHTAASHDGRPGWTPAAAARWHAAQGFQTTYITDHNRLFHGVDAAIPLLPGVEWSVYRQHILALGDVTPIDPDRYNTNTPALLALFPELHRQGALALASIPEYWESHWDDLDDFVRAGLDGFEIMNCAPRALAFPATARARVLALARQHNLLVVGGSDNHGWGKVTCVWNLVAPSAHGYRANQVVARPLALLQGEWLAWTAPYTQPWFMLRSLTWPERVSWLTWIAVILIYRAMPRRIGDHSPAVLARTLGRPRPRPGPPA